MTLRAPAQAPGGAGKPKRDRKPSRDRAGVSGVSYPVLSSSQDFTRHAISASPQPSSGQFSPSPYSQVIPEHRPPESLRRAGTP